MSEKKKENLVVFWGWVKGDISARRIFKDAPEGIDVYPITFEQLLEGRWVESIGENFIRFLNAHNLDKVFIFGHSLGAPLAVHAAYAHPDRVQGLILSDAEGIYEPTSPFQLARNFLAPSPNSEFLLNEFVGSIAKITKHPLLFARMAWLAHHIDVQKEAAEIQIPTTIIWGEQDHLTPLYQGQKLHRLIKDSEFKILKGEGHDWILFRPEQLWQNI